MMIDRVFLFSFLMLDSVPDILEVKVRKSKDIPVTGHGGP
jgi:hypothetical protein